MQMLIKSILIFLVIVISTNCKAQWNDSLNTAKNCQYMKPEEKAMIFEINMVRTNPKSYIQYVMPMLISAKKNLKENGKGGRNYSLTYTITDPFHLDQNKVDTTWHFINEEEVNALTTLVNDLRKLKPLRMLRPDSGIYNAVKFYATDEHKHNWQLMHTGSDGSNPWDRIIKFSPSMHSGNENIA